VGSLVSRREDAADVRVGVLVHILEALDLLVEEVLLVYLQHARRREVNFFVQLLDDGLARRREEEGRVLLGGQTGQDL